MSEDNQLPDGSQASADADGSKPPTLDYPTQPTEPDRSTESWWEITRAMLIVFAFLAMLFLIGFGFCGVLGRGCGMR
jgi:hypothetical protein